MKLNRGRRKRLFILQTSFFFGLIGGAIGLFRAHSLEENTLTTLFVAKGALTAFSTCLLLLYLELIIFAERLKKLSFTLTILVKTIVYTFLTVVLFIFITFVFSPLILFSLQMKMFFPVIAITAASMLIGNIVLSMVRLVGGRVLINFFSGKYHSPFEEERIFMFLDLVSSTTIAEKIGNVKFHEFLGEFFWDIADPILAHNGEIYQYIGDEVVVVWPVRNRKKNQDCINSYFEIKEKININQNRYLKNFGFVPEFRAGIHSGTVVSGEIGDYKREIVFLGDVVNTTSRIQAQCKVADKGLIASKDLLRLLDLPPHVRAEKLGAFKLRGKQREVELYGID